jgi:hypothetical protein
MQYAAWVEARCWCPVALILVGHPMVNEDWGGYAEHYVGECWPGYLHDGTDRFVGYSRRRVVCMRRVTPDRLTEGERLAMSRCIHVCTQTHARMHVVTHPHMYTHINHKQRASPTLDHVLCIRDQEVDGYLSRTLTSSSIIYYTK